MDGERVTSSGVGTRGQSAASPDPGDSARGRPGPSRRTTLGWLSGAALLSACGSGQTGASAPASGSAATKIAEGRRQIDALDGQIIDLIRQRVEVSHSVQQARMSEGGQHTDSSREQQIVARYQAALGPSGAEIAHAVLDGARGRQPH
jgi:chorismate mutase